MASKKQITELENVVIILEEKIERLEEEHLMMKQMLSMQNSLIENLQMMVKMIGCNQGKSTQYTFVPLQGGTVNSQKQNENVEQLDQEMQDTHTNLTNESKSKIREIRHRMSRVI